MGDFKERCEAVLAHMHRVTEFAKTLDQRKGLPVVDFIKLVTSFADDLEAAIDGQPLVHATDPVLRWQELQHKDPHDNSSTHGSN